MADSPYNRRNSDRRSADYHSDVYDDNGGYEVPVTRRRSGNQRGEPRGRSTLPKIPVVQESSENPYAMIGDIDGSNQLKVTHFSEKCTKDFLENYFESKKTFGRPLDVTHVEFNERARYAVVTFKEVEDAQTVMEVHKQKPCKEHDCELVIEMYTQSDTENIEDDTGVDIRDETRTIEVRGFDPNIGHDTIKYYFENTNRSGGGNTESCMMSEDKSHFLITFECNGVVDEVLKREHRLENCNLIVKKFIVSKTEILFSDFSHDATPDSISNYCEAKLKQDVVSVVFSENKSKVLVRFNGPIEFKSVQAVCKRHSLLECNMTPVPVPITDGIIVTNISDASTEDTFLYYFENRQRSSGGDVSDVQLMPADGYCLVFFKDPKVVQSVCSQDEHYLGDKFLKIDPYNACLGIPAGTDSIQFTFPDPVILDNLSTPKLKLLETNAKVKDEFTKKLQSHFAVVSWESPFPKIECSVTSSVKDYKKIAKSWTDNVKAVINDFNEMWEVRDFNFSHDERADIKQVLKTLVIADPDNVQVEIDGKTNKIILVALTDGMDNLAKVVEHAINKAKEDCKAKKERKTERREFKPWNIRYLKAVGFTDKVKQMYPQVEIDICEESSEVVLSGPQQSISETLLEIYQVNEQIHKKRVSMEKGKIGLLSHRFAIDRINQHLRDKGLGDVWEVKDNHVFLYADENDELNRMENTIENMLTKISVDIEKEAKGLLDSKEWKDLESKLCKECSQCIVIEIRGTKVEIYTLEEHGDNVDKRVKNFFATNAVFKHEVTLDANVVKYLKKYNKRDLDAEINSVVKKGKPLVFDQTKITFEGNADDIKAIKAILKKFENGVRCIPHSLNMRGIYIYISSHKGREAIATVETSAECIIDVMGKGLGSSIGKEKKGHVSRNFDKPTHCAQAKLKSGRTVIVYGGDMTILAVDVIVNASNKDMQHVGGLAAVIKRKGGSNIQKVCEDHIKQHGSLSAGDVFMSDAGKLKCSAIAHAVGPVWHDGKSGEQKHLELATENCLKETDARQLRSIAFPALSAGMFGYPVKEASLVIASTIKAYFKHTPDSTIKEVYLCDISIKTVQGFVEAAKKTFKDCKILADPGSIAGQDKRQAWLTESGVSQEGDVGSNSPFGNTVVTLVKGELIKERVDVIVNSASPDLQLKKGRSSDALLKAGGSKIQSECDKNYPNGIQTGEVAMTTGGKLRCKQVFHVALEPYKNQKTMHPLQGLKKSMVECLSMAERKGYVSISFPAMGTGAQGYPRDKVAREMFGTVANYCKNNPNTMITAVRFVVYQQDDETFEAFISEEKHWVGEEDGRAVQDIGSSGVGKVVKIKKDYGEFQFESIKVKVFQGDITEQDTVAIVASCNRDLDLNKGAVTKAIVKKGGQEIVKDCAKQKSEMQKTGITVTTAGQLRSKYIIHVDTKYKLKEWEPVMLECLEKAEKHRFSSVAFPALGTSLKCNPRDIAALLSSALASFLQQSPKHLQRVCVVVFMPDMLGPFIDGMKNALSAAVTSPRRTPSGKGSHHSNHGNRNQPKPPNIDDSCSLTIYGKSDGDITKAKKQLQAHVEQNWIEKRIQESALCGLRKSKVDKVQESGKANSVLVDIDSDRGVITLTGHPLNIIKVNDVVHQFISAFDKSQHEKKLAKYVSNTIKWFYVKNNKSNPFPDRENLTLEMSFSKKDKMVRLKDHSGGEYEVNFTDMKEWDVKNPTVKFAVIRKDLIKDVGHETPKHWMVMSGGQHLMVVQLNSNDKEYQEVVQNFTSSLGRQANILKVERIQNVTLYTQYAAKKRQMETTNPKVKNEKILWHGTDVAAVDSINNHGFNRSYCGKNATALGAGVYFAVNSQYSDQGTYTPTDSKGQKHMYRTRVLTGEYTNGNTSLRVPPVKDRANPHILYDSVTNNTGNPIMFVIFHDTQAYPEHIITYK